MMNALHQLVQRIGFTPSERRVAVFLVAAFLLGVGVKLYRIYADPSPPFDYAAMDQEFERRSHAALGADSTRPSSAHRTAAADTAAKSRPHGKRKKDLPPGSIEINSARKEDFMRLPGIGETTADRIVEYRRAHGPFSTLEELMNVRGIGKKKFERIAPACTVRK